MSRILIIEDDFDFAKELCDKLSEFGYTADFLREGIQTGQEPQRDKILRQAEDFAPDGILVDLDLVGDGDLEEGLRLIGQMKRHPVLSKAWLAALSVYIDDGDSETAKNRRKQVKERGADLAISKDKITLHHRLIPEKLIELFPEHLRPSPLPRVMIFEDSPRDIALYKKAFADRAELRILTPMKADQRLFDTLLKFDPQVIVVDLMLGAQKDQSNYQGSRIIRDISNRKEFSQCKIVVCTKYASPLDKKPNYALWNLKAELISCVLPKFPFPTADQFLAVLEEGS